MNTCQQNDFYKGEHGEPGSLERMNFYASLVAQGKPIFPFPGEAACDVEAEEAEDDLPSWTSQDIVDEKYGM